MITFKRQCAILNFIDQGQLLLVESLRKTQVSFDADSFMKKVPTCFRAFVWEHMCQILNCKDTSFRSSSS